MFQCNTSIDALFDKFHETILLLQEQGDEKFILKPKAPLITPEGEIKHLEKKTPLLE